MKAAIDRLTLLLVGLVTSGLAWAFWHYLGARAFDVLTMVFIIALAADNIRLRRARRQDRG